MSYPENEIFALRQRVGKLERQVAFLIERLGIEYHQDSNPEVTPAVAELVRAGKKIQAIKLYRQQTSASLRAAKEFIESLEI
jgi:ribosomal protein L7/L12